MFITGNPAIRLKLDFSLDWIPDRKVLPVCMNMQQNRLVFVEMHETLCQCNLLFLIMTIKKVFTCIGTYIVSKSFLTTKSKNTGTVTWYLNPHLRGCVHI